MADRVLQGLVEMTNEEYHQAEGVSNTHLTTIGVASPRHYWARYLDPQRKIEAPTPAKILGAAIHHTMLEPDSFDRIHAVMPEGLDRRTTAGKAAWAKFETDNLGKTYVKHEERSLCLAMAKALRDHPVAGPLFQDGKPEQTFFAIDPETGALIKCRTDWLTNGGMMVDLKSTENASPSAFGKSVANFRYYVQSPWYKDVLHTLYGEHNPFVFVAIEKDFPHAIGVYYLDPLDEEFGRQIARRDLNRILSCKASNTWPDYGATEAMPIKLPVWVKTQEVR